MNFITSIIRTITPKEVPKYLGRWQLEHCKVKINNTVDLANVDHCGTCGEYASDKIHATNKQNEITGISVKSIK